MPTIRLIALLVLPLSLLAETIIVEGERFTPLDDKGWHVTHQDHSWASHTYGGAWSTHGGLLGAPADSVGSVATQSITVPVDGEYRVWSRFQSPPYFNFTHRIEVHQAGKRVYSELYGEKMAMKIYSFNTKSDQLWWSWGVDHDAAQAPTDVFATLKAGPAEVRLVTVEMDKPAADPMVDLVALTTDHTDAASGPPKAIFTMQAMQQNELYVRFKNTTAKPIRMSVHKYMGHYQPVGYGGFPPLPEPVYPGGNPTTRYFPATDTPPGAWSDWTNIGPLLVLMHDEPIRVGLAGADGFQVQVARDKDGNDICGDMAIPGDTAYVVFPIDITWNKARRVQTSRTYAENIIKLAKTEWRTANGGRKPQELLYFGQVAEDHALKDALGYNTRLPAQYEQNPVTGYYQHSPTLAAVEDLGKRLGKGPHRVVSYGDETVIEYDLAHEMTLKARKLMGPQVETGVNYSPHYPLPQYYGSQHDWIDIFKKGPEGLTMFWTEDYLFSVPQLPQTLSWTYAMINCGVKYHNQKIHMYVMPHSPGQLPSFLRRNMVMSIGAGARHIDSFCVAPSQSHTENYISWGYTDMFRVLHESIYDSGEAEPYQIGAKLRRGRVAVVLSRATETNESKLEFPPASDPFMGMCKNAAGESTYNRQTLCRKDQTLLYLALTHSQHKVDLITEDDIIDGYLKDYDAVHFVGEWIDQRVVPIMSAWVEDGGILYATAGAGHLDEAGERCDSMLELLGLRGTSMTKNIQVMRPLLELPLVDSIDSITLDGSEAAIPAMAMRQVLEPGDATVIGKWSDGSAAVTTRDHGKGKAITVGTLAGTTYIRTGLKPIPFARGGDKTAYNPTEFTAAATRLARLGLEQADIAIAAECSNNFVETLVMDSDKGTLLTLINWDNAQQPGLSVKVRVESQPQSVRSVQSQQPLANWTYADGVLSFVTDLEWADYILIEK